MVFLNAFNTLLFGDKDSVSPIKCNTMAIKSRARVRGQQKIYYLCRDMMAPPQQGIAA